MAAGKDFAELDVEAAKNFAEAAAETPQDLGLRLAVAAQDAKFATPGVNIGLFCSTPMVALSRNVGRKRALEMAMTGDPIDAARFANVAASFSVEYIGIGDMGFHFGFIAADFILDICHFCRG